MVLVLAKVFTTLWRGGCASVLGLASGVRLGLGEGDATGTGLGLVD
jgi:hypothetical protein